MKKETRTIFLDEAKATVETREDGARAITGLGSLFYDGTSRTEYPIYDGVVERIAPTAFDDVMSDDVRGLINHDVNIILGRTSAGTMTIAKNENGITYSIPFDDSDPDHVRWMRKIEKKDITGSSFSFMIAENGSEVTRENGQVVRTITKIDRLFDIGPVTFPAYTETTATARTEDVEKALEEFRKEEEERNKRSDVDALELDLSLMDKKLAMG
jgi:HK97 family phage prohead protease